MKNVVNYVLYVVEYVNWRRFIRLWRTKTRHLRVWTRHSTY